MNINLAKKTGNTVSAQQEASSQIQPTPAGTFTPSDNQHVKSSLEQPDSPSMGAPPDVAHRKKVNLADPHDKTLAQQPVAPDLIKPSGCDDSRLWNSQVDNRDVTKNVVSSQGQVLQENIRGKSETENYKNLVTSDVQNESEKRGTATPAKSMVMKPVASAGTTINKVSANQADIFSQEAPINFENKGFQPVAAASSPLKPKGPQTSLPMVNPFNQEQLQKLDQIQNLQNMNKMRANVEQKLISLQNLKIINQRKQELMKQQELLKAKSEVKEGEMTNQLVARTNQEQKTAKNDEMMSEVPPPPSAVGPTPHRNSLQNLKQNQNLFLSLQSKEDKSNRWKYTLLVLDNMIDQIMKGEQFGYRDKESDNIDFVKIAENLPKLIMTTVEPKSGGQTSTSGPASEQRGAIQLRTAKNSESTRNIPKSQKISIQPRICSRLWESLRQSLRESFKMELEFYDHTRQEIVQNFWTESLLMFKKRLRIYLENQDLLTIKQRDYAGGRTFVEDELRSQRLIQFYCEMCEKAETNGLASRSRVSGIQIGQSLQKELEKHDKITEEEEKQIMIECDIKNGDQGCLYEKIEQVLNKILNEVNLLHKERDLEIFKNQQIEEIKWTNVEIAQLLVAIYNLGEGEWFEIQKRLNFQSSECVKTPNQVAHKWRQIKRIMKKDMKKLSKKLKGQKLMTKYEWIVQALRNINSLDPSSIGLTDQHLSVLHNASLVNPQDELTPYQQITLKFRKEIESIQTQKNLQKQEQDRLRRQQKMEQQLELKKAQEEEKENLPIKIELQADKNQDGSGTLVGQKQTHSQRFLNKSGSAALPTGEVASPIRIAGMTTEKFQRTDQVPTAVEPLAPSVTWQDVGNDPNKSRKMSSSEMQKILMMNSNMKSSVDLNSFQQNVASKSPSQTYQSKTRFDRLSVDNLNSKNQTETQRKNELNNIQEIIQAQKFNELTESQNYGSIKSLQINSLGRQKSSIHEVQPGINKTKHPSNFYVQNGPKKQSQVNSSNDLLAQQHPHPSDAALPNGSSSPMLTQQLNHPMYPNKQIQSTTTIENNSIQIPASALSNTPGHKQQITINNNINITTIHNGVLPSQSSLHASNSTNNLIQQSMSQINKNVSTIFQQSKQKNHNLNLLIQNPLNQIQAPQQQQSNERSHRIISGNVSNISRSESLQDFAMRAGTGQASSTQQQQAPQYNKQAIRRPIMVLQNAQFQNRVSDNVSIASGGTHSIQKNLSIPNLTQMGRGGSNQYGHPSVTQNNLKQVQLQLDQIKMQKLQTHRQAQHQNQPGSLAMDRKPSLTTTTGTTQAAPQIAPRLPMMSSKQYLLQKIKQKKQ